MFLEAYYCVEPSALQPLEHVHNCLTLYCQRSFNLVVGGCQVGGSTLGLGLKNLTHQFHSKHMVNARPVVMGNKPLCMGGQSPCSKAQVKDRLMGHSHW
jgi:hypothetical protein